MSKGKYVIAILAITGFTIASYKLYKDYQRRQVYNSVSTPDEASAAIDAALAGGN